MKILSIATRVPQLDAKGDQLVAYHRLMSLIHSEHQIELICCLIAPPTATDESALRQLNALGITCHIVIISRFAQLRNLLSAFFTPPTPLQSGLFRSPICQRLIDTQIRDFNPDILYLILFRPYINIRKIDKPLVIDFIDSVSLNYMRTLHKKSLLFRPIFNLEAKRSRQHEQELARRAAFAFVVAEDDAKNIDPDYVRVLHNGVDTTKFPNKRNSAEGVRIIFSGNMNYSPNIEAVSWFCKNCWPKINRINPEVKFVICGANPSKAVESLSTTYSNVIVTGRVESIATELNKSSISIAPMQSGAGMQNKILEAMSCGLPVVTTTLGRGSIDAKLGAEIMVADEPENFTEHVLKLLSCPELRESIGSRARSYISQNHDWAVIGNSFVSLIESISRN